jgi:hypothetical protein
LVYGQAFIERKGSVLVFFLSAFVEVTSSTKSNFKDLEKLKSVELVVLIALALVKQLNKT